jgi:hypothetical protein
VGRDRKGECEREAPRAAAQEQRNLGGHPMMRGNRVHNQFCIFKFKIIKISFSLMTHYFM